MIYLVTNSPQLFDSSYFTIITIEKSKKIIQSLSKILGLDTETTGLNPHTKELLTVQIGNKEHQVVIDCTTISIEEYSDILQDSEILYILANAKFDIQFLMKHNIVLKRVWDVMLAEQILYLGYPKGSYHADLKTLEWKYLHKDMDKSVRGKITKVGLTTEVIQYAANDVVDLEDLMNEQIKVLEKEELVKAVQLENRFVVPLAYMEWCGIKLDRSKWLVRLRKYENQMNENREALNNYIIKLSETDKRFKKFVYVDTQGDLFTGFDLAPKVRINWESSDQVVEVFKLLGINTKTIDKKTKKEKHSIEKKILEPQKELFPILPIYLDYKEASHQVSSFGMNFINQLDENDRLHTKFHQLGTDTCRIATGGKDKKAGIEYINFLNIPSDEETRACFIAEKGNSWISIDYSGQESFLMASISNDKALIHELTEGCKDIHSLTAYMSYPDKIPRDTPIKDIKEKYHELRALAKKIEFAITP